MGVWALLVEGGVLTDDLSFSGVSPLPGLGEMSLLLLNNLFCRIYLLLKSQKLTYDSSLRLGFTARSAWPAASDGHTLCNNKSETKFNLLLRFDLGSIRVLKRKRFLLQSLLNNRRDIQLPSPNYKFERASSTLDTVYCILVGHLKKRNC